METISHDMTETVTHFLNALRIGIANDVMISVMLA